MAITSFLYMLRARGIMDLFIWEFSVKQDIFFIESFKSEPRHRSDFHEGTPKYNNNNNVIINILDQIYASFKT